MTFVFGGSDCSCISLAWSWLAELGRDCDDTRNRTRHHGTRSGITQWIDNTVECLTWCSRPEVPVRTTWKPPGSRYIPMELSLS